MNRLTHRFVVWHRFESVPRSGESPASPCGSDAGGVPLLDDEPLPGAALPFDELPLPEDVRSDGSGVGWWRDLRRSKLRLFLRCDPV
jgi:hypothetical protein